MSRNIAIGEFTATLRQHHHMMAQYHKSVECRENYQENLLDMSPFCWYKLYLKISSKQDKNKYWQSVTTVINLHILQVVATNINHFVNIPNEIDKVTLRLGVIRYQSLLHYFDAAHEIDAYVKRYESKLKVEYWRHVMALIFVINVDAVVH